MGTKWLFAVVLCVACGGSGSGVAGTKRLTALGDAEVRALCEYLIDVAGPERTIDCGDGLKLTIGGESVDRCIADTIAAQVQYPGCEATVADREACAEAIASISDSQICNGEIADVPPACMALVTVECGGG